MSGNFPPRNFRTYNPTQGSTTRYRHAINRCVLQDVFVTSQTSRNTATIMATINSQRAGKVR